MQKRGFHSEWITIGEHRIFLECRDSFPTEMMRFVARVAVEACTAAEAEEARVIGVFYDDKAGIWDTIIGSTNEEDECLAKIVTTALQAIYQNGNHRTIFKAVKPGDIHSDHYCHMRHLSVQTGVSLDS